MSKLDRIIDTTVHYPGDYSKEQMLQKQAKQQIKDLMLELIGEDINIGANSYLVNTLKSQLREKVNEL